MNTVLAFDLAPSHSGAVLFRAGQMKEIHYTSEKKGVMPSHTSTRILEGVGVKVTGTHLDRPKGMDRDKWQHERMCAHAAWVDAVLRIVQPQLVVIEAFAFGTAKMAQGAYDKGGLGWYAQIAARRHHALVRTYSPPVLKKAVTGKGNADKDAVVAAVLNRGLVPEEVRRFSLPGDKKSVEDVCDAAALAWLGSLELDLRAGRVLLSEVEQGVRDVMLAVSDKRPTNMLDREWY